MGMITTNASLYGEYVQAKAQAMGAAQLCRFHMNAVSNLPPRQRMNIEDAIQHINNARKRNAVCSGEAHAEVDAFLKEALQTLQPKRYVLHDARLQLYIIDTKHPEYEDIAGENFSLQNPWVVLCWSNPTRLETAKARAFVEHLNSTATQP